MSPRILKAVMVVSEVRGQESLGRFVGRAPLLARLDALIERGAGGQGGLVVVSGEPGIGKTRVAQECVRLAGGHGMEAAWSACVQDRHAPGFWPWTQLVRAVLAGVPEEGAALGDARLLTEVGVRTDPASATPGSDPELARYALFDAVLTVLRTVTRRQPMLLVIDDVHWADDPSLSLLRFISGHLATLPVVVVATCREGEAGSPEAGRRLDDLLVVGTRVDLTGLDEEELGDLVADVHGAAIDRNRLADLHRRTGGNPLFAVEISRVAGSATGWADLPLPGSIQSSFAGRSEAMSPDTKRLLDAAAVVGTPFTPETMSAVLGHDRLDVLAHIDEAIDRRLLRVGPSGRYEFVHSLAREAIYARMGLAVKVRMHERVADALLDLAAGGVPIDPAEIAHHLSAASPAGRAPDAVAYRCSAGDAAMRLLAYEEAVRHFSAARDLVDRHPGVADRTGIMLSLGAAQLATGDVDGARATHLAAAESARTGADPDQLARAALGLGGGLVGFEVALFDHEQVALLEEALAALDETAALRPFVLARLSVAMSLDAPVERRAELSRQAVELARGRNDTIALASTLASHCDVIAGPADSEERLEGAQEIVRLAEDLGDARLELLGRRLAIVALLETGNMAGADVQITAYGRRADAIKQPTYSWYVPLWRSMQALGSGRIDAATALLAEAETVGRRVGSANAELLVGTLNWWLLVETARFDEQWALLESMTDHPGWYPSALHLTFGYASAVAGDVDAARHRLAQVGVAGLASMHRDSEWLALVAAAVIIARVVGDRDVATWAYEELLPYRHRFIVDGIGAHCLGVVERPLGLAAATLNRTGEAEAHFERAVAAGEAVGMPLVAAAALRDGALALGDPGWYRRAIEAYERLSIPSQVADLSARLAAVEAMHDGVAPSARATAPVGAPGDEPTGEFVCEGEYWRMSWAGRAVHVKDSKGVQDLAVLLANPGREVPALDLTGAPSGGDLGEVIDAQARAAYQARLAELDDEIDDADLMGDVERSSRAIAEKDALIEQLTAAYGMGGRVRKAGDPGEKARSAVSWRIRHAVQRITETHPDLGKHLKNSVRTGRFVVYDPERPVTWTVR